MRFALALLAIAADPTAAQDAVPLLPDLSKTPGTAH